MRIPLDPLLLTNPGASSSRTIYDSDQQTNHRRPASQTRQHRVAVCFFTNVADAVFTVEWYPRGGATPRSVFTETVVASTFYENDVRLLPGRTVIRIATTTAPGTWELEAEVADDQALAQ